jgi:hypothetical protein
MSIGGAVVLGAMSVAIVLAAISLFLFGPRDWE